MYKICPQQEGGGGHPTLLPPSLPLTPVGLPTCIDRTLSSYFGLVHFTNTTVNVDTFGHYRCTKI